ncbi:hypothetical protein AAE021_05690 [Arthrobacter citreus]|uniref:DUF695 domain-containing protein n=1 Tax=Arthrobacter citreus TaxID=1670 RepID=A0ABZ2ZYW5_9MICC
MGLFTRRDSAVPADPAEAFWQWWSADGASRFSAGADTGRWGGLAGEMQERLAAVHPDLAWDTGTGHKSRHLLAVSSEGDPALRRTAEHWLRCAPAADDAWEYAAARQPVPDAAGKTIEIDGHSLSLGQARFGLREDPGRGRLDVVVHHPLFRQVAQERRLQVSLLLLDWILGEDEVTRWVGAVDTATGGTLDRTAADLRDTVSALAAQTRNDWVVMEGSTPGGAVIMVLARRPLRWIDFPLFDLHTEVRLAYDDADASGPPTPASLEVLREKEARISAALGTRAILVARVSAAGTRVLHYYSDSVDHHGRAVIEDAVRAAGGAARTAPDPGWTHVRQFS